MESIIFAVKVKMRTRSQYRLSSNFGINSLTDDLNQISFLNHKRYKSNKTKIKKNSIQNKPAKIPTTKKFLNKSITSLSYWKNNTKIGSGLKNIGNTCYINSVLQCLFYIPPLKNFLYSSKHSNNCHIKGICFLCEYEKLNKLTQKSQKITGGVIPSNIIKNLSYIASNFIPGSQEDAHEFLLYFITCLEISYMKYTKQVLNRNNSNALKNFNVIQGIFGGKIVSQVKCGKCKTISSKIENFTDISLDIAKNDNLFSSFGKFCEVEKLTGDNKYFCEKCQKKCDSEKKFLFKECKFSYNFQ